MSMRKRIIGASLSLTAIAALSLTPLAATAVEPTASDEAASSDMAFVSLTSANAAQFGYEIRVDDQGYEYGVPIGTPAGSETRSACRRSRPRATTACTRG